MKSLNRALSQEPPDLAVHQFHQQMLAIPGELQSRSVSSSVNRSIGARDLREIKQSHVKLFCSTLHASISTVAGQVVVAPGTCYDTEFCNRRNNSGSKQVVRQTGLMSSLPCCR